VIVTIAAGEYGVSPGQACVLYAAPGSGQQVLGGGFIASRFAPDTLVAIDALAGDKTRGQTHPA
jgi:hypothetical protein